MRITYAAPMGQERYTIDAGALNEALKLVITGKWIGSHNAHEAIVDIDDPADESKVREVIEAHIAPGAKDKRLHNEPIDQQIKNLEQQQTQRMLREAALGDKSRLTALDDQIKVLRGNRQ